MAILLRFLLVLGFTFQVALGPSQLTLEVCRGRLQLPAADGAPCCQGDQCGDEGPTDDPAVEHHTHCTDCFEFVVEASQDPQHGAESIELPGPAALASDLGLMKTGDLGVQTEFVARSRPPPGAVKAAGLLPGTFPLRI